MIIRFSASALLTVLVGCATVVSAPGPSPDVAIAFDLLASSKPIGVQDITLRPGPDVRYFLGVDAVLLAPNAGLKTPTRVSITTAKIIGGGTLGSDNAISPDEVVRKFVLFLPPRNANGEVVYRPSCWAQQLAPYARAKGIGVVSLDETPRGLVDALTVGDPIEDDLIGVELPPVIIFSRGPAQALFPYWAHPSELPDAGGVGHYFSGSARWVPRKQQASEQILGNRSPEPKC